MLATGKVRCSPCSREGLCACLPAAPLLPSPPPCAAAMASPGRNGKTGNGPQNALTGKVPCKFGPVRWRKTSNRQKQALNRPERQIFRQRRLPGSRMDDVLCPTAMSNSNQSPPGISLTLLGGLTLRRGEEEMTSIPRKVRALLAYLVMQDGKAVSREAMSELLWAEGDPEQGRHSLRQALLVLRRDMGGTEDDLVHAANGMLSLQPSTITTDAVRFRMLAASPASADLAEAAELYAGPFLAQFPAVGAEFDEWVSQTRSVLAEAYMNMLGRLAYHHGIAGESDAMIATLNRMLALDPMREDLHRRLIEAYAAAGRRADAIRQYGSCVDILRRELDVAPAAETDALVARIRHIDAADELISNWTDVVGTPGALVRASAGIPWIAILPFGIAGDDRIPQYWGIGLAEDIIALIATLREPIVISSNSTYAFRENRPSLHKIRELLGVSYVVSGSVRRSGTSMRIYVELAETENSAVLWAQTYCVSDVALFDAQDDIALRVVNTIIPHIHDRELRRIRTKRPESMTAYDLVLRSRELMLRLDRALFDQAGHLLRLACGLDRGYAAAHAGLAQWHSLRIGQGWSSDQAEDVSAIDLSALTAIACDKNHARALAFYGHFRSFLHRDYDRALNLFERAVEAAPNDSLVWKWSSTTFAYIGDGAEAARRAEQARRLSPDDVHIYGIYSSLCVAHYVMDDYESAVRWGDLSHRSNPRYTSNARFLIASLVALERLKDAREIAQSVTAIDPKFRVNRLISRHPFRDEDKRRELGRRLIQAGLPE